MTSTPLKVHGALFAVAVLFSANYIISKLGMNAFSPLVFAWIRVAGSTLVLWSMLPRERTPLSRSEWKETSGLAILGVVINQTLFLGGLALTSAHVAAILIATIPVFTLATAIVLKREQPTFTKIAGIALAAIGALFIVGFEGVEGTGRTLAGAVMIVFNCLSYSIYLVVSKPAMMRRSPRAVLAPMFLIGTVLMLPIAGPALATQRWDVPAGAWIALAFVIAGPTVGAYVLNGWALARTDSSMVAAYTYLQPIMTTVLAAIFLDERLTLGTAVSGAVIFAGVWLSGRKG